MRLIGHGFAACALIVFVETTSACSSRPAQPGRAPEPPGTAATPSQPAPAGPPPVEATPTLDAAADDCALIRPGGELLATVGLTDRIDLSNAPRPTNASERLLFSQLYETLVRVDCMGRVRPGLAASWRLEQNSVGVRPTAPRDGHIWIVTLRDNARFSDGTPVTAADVRAGWIRDGIDRQFPTYVSPLVVWVDAVDDRTLEIRTQDPRVDVPVTLAHRDLAIAKRVANSPLPLGTRASRIETRVDAAGGIGASELTVSRDHLPPLRFLLARTDPRDLLDAGADLLITRDAATLDYAATVPHFERVPLDWQRTYVFLTSGRSASSPSLSDDARQALAADAVRGEARGAQGPFWFANCPLGPLGGMRPHVPTPRIVYDANDAAARDLAERLVALAAATGPAATAVLEALLPDRPRRTFQRATGLTGEALANARRDGTDAGYIISVDSRPLEPCAELLGLQDRFHWLRAWSTVPLVDTRQQAVVRRGRSGLATDFDGLVLIDGLNDPGSR